MDEFITLTDDTLYLVMERTRWPLAECIQLIAKGHRMGGKFAVFTYNDRWHRVFVFHRYDMAMFLKDLFERLP